MAYLTEASAASALAFNMSKDLEELDESRDLDMAALLPAASVVRFLRSRNGLRVPIIWRNYPGSLPTLGGLKSFLLYFKTLQVRW